MYFPVVAMPLPLLLESAVDVIDPTDADSCDEETGG